MINLLYLKLISLSTETGGTKKKKKDQQRISSNKS